ncbi:uncharacterized protein LAESUDRAFT_661835 [Laetiporus sulphureus 93-53]|uniref:Uncharacterized protein n=1 Tax=Laetiporus sulphureus 93-53 TaxID=1314785 RepID=A0A165CAS2_9APHY|nr:uncharacterized protein LAESUDRAFT_661835 [Laetiporus sulphureus 93-53]KZT02474.1 hypothetical protein LAESUDRAFT_661835 [Laetiporus sulphureus 93-53]
MQAATLFSISVPQIDPTLVNAYPLPGSSSHTTSQDNTSLLHQSQGEDGAAAEPKPRQRLSQKQSAGDQGEFAADWEYGEKRYLCISTEIPTSIALDRGTDEQSIRSGKSRSRRAPDAASHSERDDEPLGGPKRRRHRISTGSRKPRTRTSSVVPFELNTGPGEELDPTAVMMATLCDDTGQGRISSKTVQIMTNHAAWRAANREKRERMKAAMEAKKYGRTIQDEDQPPPKADTEVTESLEDGVAPDAVLAGPSASIENRPTKKARRANDDFDYTQNLATSRYNVQVRIGANGEAIIDEDSLFVNRNEEEHTEHYTHVEESDTTKFVNSLTYSRKLRGSRWSAEETELFYDALSQFGENYELIAYVLPGRDRKSCKNKFKAEDKKNPARINYCLNNRKPVDIQTLSRMTGKDFSGPTPIIRAPTPLRSTQLDANLHSASIEDPRSVKENSKTPGPAGEAEEEILGSVDEIEDGNGPSRGGHTTEYPQKPYI